MRAPLIQLAFLCRASGFHELRKCCSRFRFAVCDCPTGRRRMCGTLWRRVSGTLIYGNFRVWALARARARLFGLFWGGVVACARIVGTCCVITLWYVARRVGVSHAARAVVNGVFVCIMCPNIDRHMVSFDRHIFGHSSSMHARSASWTAHAKRNYHRASCYVLFKWATCVRAVSQQHP